MEKWHTESLVKHLSPAISLNNGKAEGRGGTLQSSSSFKPLSLCKGNPFNPGDDNLTCKHSNPTKFLNSGGNKLISFAKNFNIFNLPNSPNRCGIKLNTFLYKYNPSTVLSQFSNTENSKFLPETSRIDWSSALFSPVEAASNGFDWSSFTGSVTETTSPESGSCIWVINWENKIWG